MRYDRGMTRTFGTLLAIALAGAIAMVGHAASELLPITAATSVAGVQTAAERVVGLFAAATGDVLGFEPPAPAVAIRNTPNLAYYDPRSGTIVIAHWPTLDTELRAFFLGLSDTEEHAGALFVALFNEFLVAHEMGHWVQRGLRVARDRYGAEREANDIAVAFFRTVEGGEARLVELHTRVRAALERLADPTPIGADERQFFNERYAELATNPVAYGYYQFRFILASIDAREQLDFTGLLRRMVEE